MKRLIDVTCLLAKQELQFRGHNEQSRNYVEFLQLLSKYDAKLATHLQNSTVFKGTSNRIKNDIIESVSEK